MLHPTLAGLGGGGPPRAEKRALGASLSLRHAHSLNWFKHNTIHHTHHFSNQVYGVEDLHEQSEQLKRALDTHRHSLSIKHAFSQIAPHQLQVYCVEDLHEQSEQLKRALAAAERENKALRAAAMRSDAECRRMVLHHYSTTPLNHHTSRLLDYCTTMVVREQGDARRRDALQWKSADG